MCDFFFSKSEADFLKLVVFTVKRGDQQLFFIKVLSCSKHRRCEVN